MSGDHNMNSNPVAMPAHYGYDVLTQYEDGMEDPGDKIAMKIASREKKKKYVGFVERQNMEEIVSEAMKEVYSAHTEELVKKQVGGNHYKVAAIQPWDVMAAYGLDPWSANVLKYLLRFPYKAGRQDLEKAQHYIEYLITHYDEVNDTYYNK